MALLDSFESSKLSNSRRELWRSETELINRPRSCAHKQKSEELAMARAGRARWEKATRRVWKTEDR